MPKSAFTDLESTLLRSLSEERIDPQLLASVFQRLSDNLPPGESLSPVWLQHFDLFEGWRHMYPEAFFRKITNLKRRISGIDLKIKSISLRPNDEMTILLGAGASAPSPSNIPVVAHLLPELWRRAKKIGRDDLNALSKWCEDRSITNIEDLLTAAYVADFSAKNSNLISLLEYFLFSGAKGVDSNEEFRIRNRRRAAVDVDVSSIALFQSNFQTLFGLLASAMIPAEPNAAHHAIVDLIEKHKKVRIVTTNYDGCMDQALLTRQLTLKKLVDLEQGAHDEHCIDLIKIHGSISWFYCDSCQAVQESSILEIKDMYSKDAVSYPVIGICRACGGQRRPMLVPPLSFKFMMFPNLIGLWDSARRAIESSKLVIVVGYSFADADSHINKMISRSLSQHTDQKLIVVDRSPAVVDRIRERYASMIENFDPDRILQAIGSCEEILPEVIRMILGEDKTPKGTNRFNKQELEPQDTQTF